MIANPRPKLASPKPTKSAAVAGNMGEPAPKRAREDDAAAGGGTTETPKLATRELGTTGLQTTTLGA